MINRLSFKYYAPAIFVILLLIRCASLNKNTGLYCRGEYVKADPIINNLAPCSFCDINITELKKGFTINLTDSNYKVIAFKIFISDTGKVVFRKDVSGNKVTRENVNYISKLQPGDVISLECINVYGSGGRYITTNMLIATMK